MHPQAETERAAAWNRATEAILEICPAVVKVNKSETGNIGYRYSLTTSIRRLSFGACDHLCTVFWDCVVFCFHRSGVSLSSNSFKKSPDARWNLISLSSGASICVLELDNT